MFHKTISKGFFVLSWIALLEAMYGWAVQDFWLASTQWMQVAVVFLLMAIYVKMYEDDDLKEMANRKKNTKKSKRK